MLVFGSETAREAEARFRRGVADALTTRPGKRVAVVSHGTREEMERDAEALQGYGLWATYERDQ